jgi:diguanylate cyclase (GGDEF)-like protein/PAS domain S-box-containing protein
VEAVEDGCVAFQSCQTKPPDLVLSDVMMPVMNGFDLLKLLREDKRTSVIPVILLSARAGEESRIEGLAAGADDYLVKPFSARELIARIDGTVKLAQVRRDAEKTLRESEERYHSLFANMLDGFAYCKMLYEGEKPCDFIYVDVNNSFEKLTGLKSVTGKKVSEVIPGIQQSNPELLKTYGRVATSGIPERFETYVSPLGIWVNLTAYSLEKGYFVVVFENITERKKTERQLLLAANVYNNITEGIVTTLPDGTIISVNPAFCLITGYSETELIGANPRLLKSGRQDVDFYRVMWDSISQDGYWQGEMWNRRKDGSLYIAHETITAIRDNHGELQNYVGVQNDITEVKQIEENIRHQAYHDPLTKLPNRTLFMDRLRHQLAYSHRQQTCMAVLFIDLDGFKAINDNLGHQAGDDLLKEVAVRLRECVRESDTIARLGGDEFTAIISDIKGAEDAAPVAQKMLDMMCAPFQLGSTAGRISASIGIAHYPTDSDNAVEILKLADDAMYEAKRNGKANFVLASRNNKR